jgi:hypothetical protein
MPNVTLNWLANDFNLRCTWSLAKTACEGEMVSTSLSACRDN